MKEIIRQIRLSAGLSQEEFARALGTTAVSVNRWENGKSNLNRIAQRALYLFCAERGIPAADFIVKSYERTDEDERPVFYHASRKGLKGPIAPISRELCDFGRGFYMGTNALQPLTLVCSEEKPTFYAAAIDLSGLSVRRLDANLDWAMLIAFHRRQMETAAGTRLYEKYAHFLDGCDIVSGPIADDRMYTVLTDFFNGTITDVALMKCLAALDLGTQYVAKTKRACERIEILSARAPSYFELTVLRDRSVERRKEGRDLAEQVIKQYRREGRYFDEIVGDAP